MTNFFHLVFLSFFTSAMSAVLGLGGGLLLIAFMANVLPPIAVIPVHAIVQLFSNLSRGLFAWRELVWEIIPAFIFGAFIGSVLAFPFLSSFPPEYLPLPLACFILLMTWLPKFNNPIKIPGAIFFLGILQGFLSLFVGATGTMNPPFLMRRGLSNSQVVATQSHLMTIVHILKIIVFGLIGFSFSEHIQLITAMIAAVIAGSWFGTNLRGRMPDYRLRIAMKAVITLLAIRMIFVNIL